MRRSNCDAIFKLCRENISHYSWERGRLARYSLSWFGAELQPCPFRSEFWGPFPVEVAAFVVIAKIGEKIFHHLRILPHPAGKANGMAGGFHQGAEKFRWIPKTLPVTPATKRGSIDGAHVEILVFAKVLIPSIPAGVGVTIFGIYEKEADSAQAGVKLPLGFVLLDQSVEGAQRREDANLISKLGNYLHQGFKQQDFLIFGEADQILFGRCRVDGLFFVIHTHGVAGIDKGEPQIDDKAVKI